MTHALFEAMGGESLPRALPPNAPVPESERERALLLRFYLSFVHGLVHNGLVCVFVSPPNDASLERFLSVLIEVRRAAARTGRMRCAALGRRGSAWRAAWALALRTGVAEAAAGLHRCANVS